MPVSIKVNGMFNSLVHQGSNGISVATIPDVCKTPSPGGPVPVPYPNISMASNLAKGSTTVKADGGMMIATKGSEFSLSNGDNAGVAGGVVSSTFMKESTWLLYSFDVKIDGANACRLMDKKFHNHQNTVNLGGVLQPPVVPMDGAVQVKVPELVGEVLEFHWLDSLDISRAKARVSAPHWTSSESVDEEDDAAKQRYVSGSKKPALYAMSSGAKSAKVKLKIRITKSENVAGQGTISGRLGRLNFEAACATSVGTHDVEITLPDLSDAVRHYEGDVPWTLSTAETTSGLKNKTRLEMFVVYQAPMRYFVDGVWVEALRFVFKKGGVGGLNSSESIAAAIARLCHTRHGMAYDTVRGGSHFGAGPKGTTQFELMSYMAKDGDAGNIVNCYDQAAAIQSLAGAMGVRLDWIFLNPYGYIKPTTLVGVGLCNNPFFKGNGSNPLVEWDSSKRTAFGNHAFANLGSRTLDACAGPHVGTETFRQYLEAAIDAKRSIAGYADAKDLTEEIYWKHLEGLPNPMPGVSGVM